MDAEKGPNVQATPPDCEHASTVENIDTAIDCNNSKVDEAIDIYGDAATAEKFGYVSRG